MSEINNITTKLNFNKTTGTIFHNKGMVVVNEIKHYDLQSGPDNTFTLVTNVPGFNPIIPEDKAKQVLDWLEEVIQYSRFPREKFIFTSNAFSGVSGSFYIDLDTVCSFESYAVEVKDTEPYWMIKLYKIPENISDLSKLYYNRSTGSDYFIVKFENENEWNFACLELTRLMNNKNNWGMGIKPQGIGYPKEPLAFAW